LRWLAAFGITHALNEWGDLFIPIQANYLSELFVRVLLIIQLILLAASFACLLEFGISLLNSVNRLRWLRGLSAVLLASWLFVIFFVILPFESDLKTWHHIANALARYFIGFPGGLLAAYGLRVYTIQRIQPLNVPVIFSTLRIAGVSLGIYAILGGLIPPPINFFPGTILNTHTFEQVVSVPPILFRTLISIVIVVTIIRSLEVFDLETRRTIERLEQQQIINTEHERLARELHDGRWEGWLEFVPSDTATSVYTTPIETRQRDRETMKRWASGLTRVYAEGALARARNAAGPPPARG
jgi:hypothetical protein